MFNFVDLVFISETFSWSGVAEGGQEREQNSWVDPLPFVARTAFLQNICTALHSGEIDCLGINKTGLRNQIFTFQWTGTRK